MPEVYSKETEIVNYYRIPVEVAQDHELSDGAILLFGEIFGLFAKYGNCEAGDAHFMARRGKGATTIQRQLRELEARGHIQITNPKPNERQIVVPSRYLGSKENPMPENGYRPMPESGDKAESIPESGDKAESIPENGHQPIPENGHQPIPENGHLLKTLNTKNLKESKTQESSTPVFENAHQAWKMFGERGSLISFENLIAKCKDRQEVWDIAVLSAQIKDKKIGLDSPAAWMRTVITDNLLLSSEAVLVRLGCMRSANASPEERRRAEAAEQAEEAEKQAHNAPPAPEVAGMLGGIAKGMDAPGKPDGLPVAPPPVPAPQDNSEKPSALALARQALLAKVQAFGPDVVQTAVSRVRGESVFARYLSKGIEEANSATLTAVLAMCQQVEAKMSLAVPDVLMEDSAPEAEAED